MGPEEVEALSSAARAPPAALFFLFRRAPRGWRTSFGRPFRSRRLRKSTSLWDDQRLQQQQPTRSSSSSSSTNQMPGGGRKAAPWITGPTWNGSSRKIWKNLIETWERASKEAYRRGDPQPDRPVWGDKSKNPPGENFGCVGMVRRGADLAAAAAAAPVGIPGVLGTREWSVFPLPPLSKSCVCVSVCECLWHYGKEEE